MRICAYFEDGSDGTRTRDLRRDRPVRAQPAQLASTPNYPPEQANRTPREPVVTGYDRVPPDRACAVGVWSLGARV